MKPHAWIAVLALLSLGCLEVSAQSTFEWIDRQSGPGNGSCAASTCLVDDAGNVYTCGGIDIDNVHFTAVSLLVKYDSSGNVLWTKSSHFPGAYDLSYDIALGSGGMVYQIDTSYQSLGGLMYCRVNAWDALGNLQWSTPLPTGSYGYRLAVGSQGQIALSENNWLNGGLLALAPTGQILWRTPQIGLGTAFVASDAQGDWYVTHSKVGAGVSKVSSTGQVLWSHTYAVDRRGHFWDLAAAPDGSTVAVGATESSATVWRMHMVAHDAAGALLWSHSLPGSGGKDVATDVAIDGNGITWVVGIQPLPVPRIAIFRYSRSGSLLSTAFHSGVGAGPIRHPQLVLGNAGQAYVLCNVEGFGEILLLEVDSTGAFTWVNAHSGGTQRGIFLNEHALSRDGKLVMATAESSQIWSMATMQIDLNDAPQAYCVAKVNSLGCSPKLAFAGQSSAAAGSGFRVIASDTLPSTAGLFLYSTAGKAAVPFQGGTLCVLSPVRRTPGAQSTAGTGCQSTRSLDLNAFASGALGGTPAPELKQPGTAVHCQAWSRDPGYPAPLNSSLSNALRYVVLP